jgi:multidrug resistance protein
LSHGHSQPGKSHIARYPAPIYLLCLPSAQTRTTTTTTKTTSTPVLRWGVLFSTRATISEKPVLQLSKQPTEPEPHFTTFGRGRRIFLTYLLDYLTLASSLTATIYFPLIETLSSHYKTSIQAINLTITLYLVFQAISPVFFGPLSDTFGRRPVFLVTFLVYCAASLGLALNKQSYAALLLLRSLQSIGGSAVMSLAYAVVADISVPAERGKILGLMLAATNLGPCVGPIIGGGILEATQQVQWCFWTLAIFGVSSFLLLGWTLPETGRSVVGNGTIPARVI